MKLEEKGFTKLLFVAENNEKLEILDDLARNNIFLNYRFLSPLEGLFDFSTEYFYFMKEQFSYEPSLSDRIKKYFFYINLKQNYQSEKLNKMQFIIKTLISEKIIEKKSLSFDEIYLVNNNLKPEFIKHEAVFDFKTRKEATKPILLTKTANKDEQAYFIFEKIVSLIEENIPLDGIKIINAKKEDELKLKKLLGDAKIPYWFNKPKKLSIFPEFIHFKKIFEEDIEEALNYLNANQNLEVLISVIDLINRRKLKWIKKLPEVFLFELSQLTILEKKKENAIEFLEFEQIFIENNHHYLLMNFYEEEFPLKKLDNDYLTDLEAKEINYPSSLIFNQNMRKKIALRLGQIENLYLSYPLKIIEQTNQSRINFKRELLVNEYEYLIKEVTYLDDLLFLDYAKKASNFREFKVEAKDYQSLNKLYKEDYKFFYPRFSGLKPKTLAKLLTRHQSLTAYKIESYQLCPFQFYLRYLLKLDSFESNIFTYLGNITHRALEMSYGKKTLDYDELFQKEVFPDPEKTRVYQKLIKENLPSIVNLVREFEDQTEFSKIYTEKEIEFMLDNQIKVKAIIDKVMIDEVTNYYLILDYKYGEKDLKIEDLTKDYQIQLPLYLYLIKKTNPKLKPAGMLYQRTAFKRKIRDEEDTNKMRGLILGINGFDQRIDPSLTRIVSGKYKEASPSKTFISEEELNQQLTRMENLVRETNSLIQKGKFIIKPILTEKGRNNKDTISCEYCPFAAICYSKNKELGGLEK